MMAHPWRGNVRELENVIERAIIFCDDRMIDEKDLALAPAGGSAPATLQGDLKTAMRDYEKFYILEALRNNDFDKRAAARSLNVGISSPYRKMEQLRIPRQEGEYRPEAPGRPLENQMEPLAGDAALRAEPT